MVILVEDDEGTLAGTFQTREEVVVYLKGLEDGGRILDKIEDDTTPMTSEEAKAYASGLGEALKVPVGLRQAEFSRAIVRMAVLAEHIPFNQGAVIRLMNEMGIH